MLSSGLTLLVLAGVGTKWWLGGTLGLSAVFALAIAVVIAGVMYARNYQRSVTFAANHALMLTSDTILIRDGASERRIPFNAIELLKVRRSYFGEANFILKVAGIRTEEFHGYDEADALISSLTRRLPRDRVENSRGHA